MKSISTVFFIKRFWRIFCLLGWLIKTLWLVYNFPKKNQQQRSQDLKKIALHLLNTLHVKLETHDSSNLSTLAAKLVVANHVSWLDIFVLLSQCQGGFIAKDNIRNWPIIGWLAKQSGAIFINRNSRSVINSINQSIEQALIENKSVLFFPEARTSNGLNTLPFKAALFQSAAVTHSPVQSMAIRYYDYNGQRTTQVAYVGDTNLFVSLWRITGLREIKVKVDYGPLLNTNADLSMDREQLKQITEKFITEKIISDSPT